MLKNASRDDFGSYGNPSKGYIQVDAFLQKLSGILGKVNLLAPIPEKAITIKCANSMLPVSDDIYDFEGSVADMWSAGTPPINAMVFDEFRSKMTGRKDSEKAQANDAIFLFNFVSVPDDDVKMNKEVPRLLVSLVMYIFGRGYPFPLDSKIPVGKFVDTLMNEKELTEGQMAERIYTFDPMHIENVWKDVVMDLGLARSLTSVFKNRMTLGPNGHKALFAAMKFRNIRKTANPLDIMFKKSLEVAGEAVKGIGFYQSLHNLVQNVQSNCIHFMKNALYAIMASSGNSNEETLERMRKMPEFRNDTFLKRDVNSGSSPIEVWEPEYDEAYISRFKDSIGLISRLT